MGSIKIHRFLSWIICGNGKQDPGPTPGKQKLIEPKRMETFDLNNKNFVLLQNSENGEVNADTIFKYNQEGNLVTADYYGGTIRYGKIIGDLQGDRMDMLYQCITTDNELKAGKALAHLSLTDDGKIKMKLDWMWLTNDNNRGVSEYVEVG
jgi:hypothetical protein